MPDKNYVALDRAWSDKLFLHELPWRADSTGFGTAVVIHEHFVRDEKGEKNEKLLTY